MALSFGFSHTAPQFTKEDEEREIADLTPEAKEDILDDLYGRNSNELIMDGDVPEITAEQLAAVRDAMNRIPIEDRSGFIKASVRCPELIERETDPAIFLRHENYDAELAAKRIAKYWSMRETLFGEEHAYLPMTQSGAMGDEDTLQMMRQCPHFRDFLPNDAHGRTVIGIDFTTFKPVNLCSGKRYDPVRIHWYILHLALKRKSTIEKGIVFMQVSTNFPLKYFDRIRTKMVKNVVYECFPVDIRALHVIAPPSPVVDLILPSVKYFYPSFYRRRIYLHRQSGTRLLHELEEFGFEKNNLPKSIGGILEWNPNWVNEQREQEDND